MNFGRLTLNSSQMEYDRVVLHEFGHALGLYHEHQNQKNNPIHWNKDIVYAYYTAPPNNWLRSDVDSNIFGRYSQAARNGTKFDPQSIMLYSIPAAFTTDHYTTKWNHTLSSLDKQFIEETYPKY